MVMKLSICIVNWNVSSLLEKCINSIIENRPAHDFEINIVDNASRDSSVDMIRNVFAQEIKSGIVNLIQNKENVGFSAGNNQAIAISKGAYILLLNPDTEVTKNSINILTEFLDKNIEAAIIAPKLLNSDGSLQRSCMGFPTFGAMAMRQTFLEALWPSNPFTKKYMMSDFKYNMTSEVDQPMGAALLIRKESLDKVGVFDESSFMFFDEVDLCKRLKDKGWKIFFTPAAEVIHHGGKSVKKWGNFNLSKHWTRSRNIFFKKHYGHGAMVWLTLIDSGKIVIIITLLMLMIFALKKLYISI